MSSKSFQDPNPIDHFSVTNNPADENIEEDDDDAATADSLDDLVTSVVGEMLETGDPYNPPPSTVPSSPSSAANEYKPVWEDSVLHGLSAVTISSSNPSSPSRNNSGNISRFDFSSTPPLFIPTSPSPKANGASFFPPAASAPAADYSMFPGMLSATPTRQTSSELSPPPPPATDDLTEKQIQMQIEELQQKLQWQQQQRRQRPAPMQDWNTPPQFPSPSNMPQYSPVHQTSFYPPAFAGSPATAGYTNPRHPASPSLSAVDKLLGAGDAPLETMEGRFLQLAQEQNGCRYLQSRIAKEGSLGAHLVLQEVFPQLVSLMTDPFANYMYQKILDVATFDQRLAMLTQVRHSLLAASLNLHGTRSVQKHIEVASQHASQDQQRLIIAQELAPHVTQLSMDTNGNHVIQRMLQHFHPNDCEFIFRAVMEDLVTVTRHRHGCCVVQRSLDASRGHVRDMLIARIEHFAIQLMQDQFANYTVQYVLEMGLGGRIVEQILGRIEPLSKQKFSSNVVEKCIVAARPEVLERIVQECIVIMGSLLHDAFANFVAQKLLEVANEVQSRRLVDAMRPHLLDLNLSCSRRVVSKIIKRLPDMVSDPVVLQVLTGGSAPSLSPPLMSPNNTKQGGGHRGGGRE